MCGCGGCAGWGRGGGGGGPGREGNKVLVGYVRHGIVTGGRREEGCGGTGVSVRVTNATFVGGNFLEVG